MLVCNRNYERVREGSFYCEKIFREKFTSCSIFLGQEVFGDFLVNDDVVDTAFLEKGEEASSLGLAGG